MTRRARVVVTTYERLNHLRKALCAWSRQGTTDFALTVADDGSGPDTREAVRAFAAKAPFPVDHVWWEHDGFRRAGILNEAVRRSAGEPLLVFTDGDCVPPKSFLENHIAAHEARSFAVGGAVWLNEETTETLDEEAIGKGLHEGLERFSDRWDLARRAMLSRVGVWLRRPHRPKILGLNVGIDRALFEEVNGYDEAFVGYGLEDDDLRDRVMALRPRPHVKNLYGRNDTIHLWHAADKTAGKKLNRSYYETMRPVRPAKGLRE